MRGYGSVPEQSILPHFNPLRARGILTNPSVTVMRETEAAKFANVFQPVGRVPLTGLGDWLGEAKDLKNKDFH